MGAREAAARRENRVPLVTQDTKDRLEHRVSKETPDHQALLEPKESGVSKDNRVSLVHRVPRALLARLEEMDPLGPKLKRVMMGQEVPKGQPDHRALLAPQG